MYEKLIKALKRAAQKPEIKPALLLEAAGAIERLESCTCPHYHRNVHDRGDDSYCDVFYRECGSVGWISTAEGLPGYFVQVATTDGRSTKIRYLLNSGGVDLWGPDLMPLNVVTRWAPIPALPEEAADEQA